VLQNGVPEKIFHCRKGVRQRDPLSPLLFVWVANMLQSIIKNAMELGLLKVPIHVGYIKDFPTIQYVDDILLIMEACPKQLYTLNATLNTFVQMFFFCS
jgi:hypothetical protein